MTDLDLRPALATLKAWCQGDRTAWSIMVADEQPLIIAGLCELVRCFIQDLAGDASGHVDKMFDAAAMAERGRKSE